MKFYAVDFLLIFVYFMVNRLNAKLMSYYEMMNGNELKINKLLLPCSK